MIKNCVICNRQFAPYRRHVKCCSEECSIRRKILQNTAWAKKRRDARREPRSCAVCGSRFFTKHNKAKTCSLQCRKVYQKERAAKYDQLYRPARPIISKNCCVCGREFLTTRSHEKLYCSQKCRNKKANNLERAARRKNPELYRAKERMAYATNPRMRKSRKEYSKKVYAAATILKNMIGKEKYDALLRNI